MPHPLELRVQQVARRVNRLAWLYAWGRFAIAVLLANYLHILLLKY